MNVQKPHRVESALESALRALNVPASILADGRWAQIESECCRVYVVEAVWGHAFLTWCDHLDASRVERHTDPIAAIEAGIGRAREVCSGTRGGRDGLDRNGTRP